MAFDTWRLDQALARRRADREAARQATLATVIRLLDQMAARYGLRRAYIFGSLAQPGRLNEVSDVDIAVEHLTPAAFFEILYNAVKELLKIVAAHFENQVAEQSLQVPATD